jgi:hypothetical protein
MLRRVDVADVEIRDLVMSSSGGSVPPGRRVVRIEGVGGDSLVFHYEDDGEPDAYDAKTAVLVTR